MPRERCSGGNGLRVELVAPLDRRGEVSRGEQTGARCERVDEQPLRRGADEREQRPQRAGERRDRVVGAEETASGRGRRCVRQHRLLERGERTGLDDVGRDGAAEPGEDQRRQPAGEREYGAGERHHEEQQPVAAAAADAGRRSADQQRDERRCPRAGRRARARPERRRGRGLASVTPMSTDPSP